MGVPVAVIAIIVVIMTMFATAAFIIYKNRDKLLTQTIDPIPKKDTEH
mgnify:CR=1 FL=1